MAQFTLSIRDGDRLIRDPNVYEFASAQEAWDTTVRMIRAMLKERDGDLHGKEVEIADATGHAIAIVRPHDVMPVRTN